MALLGEASPLSTLLQPQLELLDLLARLSAPTPIPVAGIEVSELDVEVVVLN
jgi:hypothetical protein